MTHPVFLNEHTVTIYTITNFLFFHVRFYINLALFCRYNVEWYVAPLHIQKMILFLLQKGTKTFHLILGGIFVASMESAATVKDIYKAFIPREYYCLIENNNIHSHSTF